MPWGQGTGNALFASDGDFNRRQPGCVLPTGLILITARTKRQSLHWSGALGTMRQAGICFFWRAGNFVHKPALKNGGIGTSHILFHAEAQRVSGIIDFGLSAPGYPARDLAGLPSTRAQSVEYRPGESKRQAGCD